MSKLGVRENRWFEIKKFSYFSHSLQSSVYRLKPF